MPLTAQDKAMRLTGVGASETAAVLEIDPNPKFGPLRLWCRKPTKSRAPLLLDDEEEIPRVDADGENCVPPAVIGHALEQAMRELYESRTGIKLEQSPTLRHPRFPHVLATPDGLSAPSVDRGAEIKIVGSFRAHHWADGIPEYVEAQCAQGMAVTGRSQWGLMALVGGTDLRIHLLDRDLELEEMIVEEMARFWTDYVIGDCPPPERSWEERRQYLKLKYPTARNGSCRVVVDDGVAELADRFVHITAQTKLLEAQKEAVANALIELVGDDYGIEGPWGKFLHYNVRGHVDWKAVAEELAGGPVAEALAERHRRDGHRVPQCYGPSKAKPPKTKKARKG